MRSVRALEESATRCSPTSRPRAPRRGRRRPPEPPERSGATGEGDAGTRAGRVTIETPAAEARSPVQVAVRVSCSADEENAQLGDLPNSGHDGLCAPHDQLRCGDSPSCPWYPSWPPPASLRPLHAAPGLLVGLTDDPIKWHRDPRVSLRRLDPLGLGALRVTLEWRQGQRSITGAEHDMLRRSVAAEKKAGLTVVLAVYGRPGAAPRDAVRAGELLPLHPEHAYPLHGDRPRRDLERSELRRLLAPE